MSTASAALVALAFTWLGLVLGISFIEAPLKFRAPNVTLQIGLGIGRLVFRALNTVEALIAVALVVLLVASDQPGRAATALGVAIACLACQLLFVSRPLARRSNAVLAGEDGPRSRAHFFYIGFELIKVVALILGGAFVLAG